MDRLSSPLSSRLSFVYIDSMRALCVGRHRFLSEHLGRFFESLGVACVPCVGLSEAMTLVAAHDPDAVICDFDLLATMSLASWESDPVLGRIPVIAVSLTRHPGEAHLMDVNGIAGFLYLPTLDADDARRVLAAVRRKRSGEGAAIQPPSGLSWPATTPLARVR
jgi:hypothetical protein